MFTTDEIRVLIAEDRLEEFYKDWYWRTEALKIIKEFHNECQLCKAEHKLTRATLVHHVKHLRDHPELAYSRTYTDNAGEHIQLLPLCHDCHERIHGRGVYSKRHGFVNEEKW